MSSMSHWTDGQWAVFALTIAAGIAAATLLYVARSAVLGWTPPAPLRRIASTSTPRPSIVLAERRALAAVHAPAWALEANYTPSSFAFDSSMRLDDAIALGQIARGEWTDPMAADFTDPGIGALSSIQAVTVDPTLRTSAELHAELDAWVNAYADLTPLMPETDAAREQMRINLEPARRTIELWRMRGEGGSARRALNDWRMDTPTGAFPIVVPVEA